MIDYGDYPPELAYLMRDLADLIDQIVRKLKLGYFGAMQFMEEMIDLIGRYSIAAYMTGARSGELSDIDTENIKGFVKAQIGFLDGFVAVIQDNKKFMEGWEARAESYARGIIAPYWKGKTKILPLPIMPSQSCACGGRCACAWDIVPLDENNGDYDATWTLNATRIVKFEHCQDCLERASQWRPLQIRGGVLITPIGFLAKEFQSILENEMKL